MKTKPVLIAVCTILIVLALLFFVILLGHETEGSLNSMSIFDLFNSLLNKEAKKIKDELVASAWVGTRVEMPGLKASACEIFGTEPKLVFKRGGQCTLDYGQGLKKAKWRLKGGKLIIRGQVKTEGFLDLDYYTGALNSLHLMDIESYAVVFYASDELD